MSSPTEPRSIETQIEINAPIEAVWKALTDGEELANWFPLKARVTPGVGGSVWSYWAEDMQWESPIDAWEPNKYLRVVWARPGKMGDLEIPFELGVDYHLEARGGTTVLRLVQTGFSPDDAWDNQYEGTKRGWAFQLRGLKHYLENHLGTKRDVIFARKKTDSSQGEAWDRLVGPAGLCAEGTVKDLRAGDRLAVTTATGIRLEGKVQLIGPPHHMAAFIENLRDAYFRVAVEMGCQTLPAPEVNIWLSTFGLDPAKVKQLQEGFDGLLESLFTKAGSTKG